MALVRTPDLFWIARYLGDHKDFGFAATCRKAIFDAEGTIVCFPPLPNSSNGTNQTQLTQAVAIVDHGRGPQLSTSRITVLDVFYYLHRGYDFDTIHEVMPILTRTEFDVVLDYVQAHRDELSRRTLAPRSLSVSAWPRSMHAAEYLRKPRKT